MNCCSLVPTTASVQSLGVWPLIQRICRVSISGAEEYWHENVPPGKPEELWNLSLLVCKAALMYHNVMTWVRNEIWRAYSKRQPWHHVTYCDKLQKAAEVQHQRTMSTLFCCLQSFLPLKLTFEARWIANISGTFQPVNVLQRSGQGLNELRRLWQLSNYFRFTG